MEAWNKKQQNKKQKSRQSNKIQSVRLNDFFIRRRWDQVYKWFVNMQKNKIIFFTHRTSWCCGFLFLGCKEGNQLCGTSSSRGRDDKCLNEHFFAQVLCSVSSITRWIITRVKRTTRALDMREWMQWGDDEKMKKHCQWKWKQQEWRLSLQKEQKR